MKAITFNANTNMFSLRENIIKPLPKNNEVQIKVSACALNPVDAKIKHWKHRVKNGMSADWVVGLDVCGYIESLGDGVKAKTQWRIGDEVFYYGNMLQAYGGLAEYAITTSATLFRKLKGFLPSEIVVTPCAGWTAWRAVVDKLKICTNDSLLVIGASGAVGYFAVQIAKEIRGCNMVIGVCSTPHIDYVEDIGADYVIDYKNQDIQKEVMHITQNRGVTKVLDLVGKGYDIIAASVLAFNGEMLSTVDTLSLEKYTHVFERNLSFHQLDFGTGYNNGVDGIESIVNAGIGFTQVLEEGKIVLPPINKISLLQTPIILQNLLQTPNSGKYVVDPSL